LHFTGGASLSAAGDASFPFSSPHEQE